MRRKAGQSAIPTFRNELHQDILDSFQLLLAERANLDLNGQGERWEAKRFAIDYLREVLLSKFVGDDTAPADLRRQRAIDKWLETEKRNAETNIRVLFLDEDFGRFDSEALLAKAARLILSVIGRAPPQDILYGIFTGGASTSQRRELGVVARKFTGKPDVTREAYGWWISSFLHLGPTWFQYNPELSSPEIVEGNVLFTVPKSTEIDRVAAKEPDLNMWMQKGIGAFLRKRLRSRAHVDLDDQSINRNLAREGSRDGRLATIDLSSASDSVTTGLVQRLLPLEWFLLLDACRCKRTLIDGSVHENEMFSSMGNAFTFELESLVFWAISLAVKELLHEDGVVSVYGDDIVVPSVIVPTLIEVFSFCGFVVNTTKSFWEGYFRESCGGHYYRGYDVTPFYVKEPIRTLDRLIHFLNRVRNFVLRDGGTIGQYDDQDFQEFWSKWARLVPRKLWGGHSCSDPSRLVSPGHGRYSLQRRKIRRSRLEEECQLGLYLQDLRSRDRTPVDDRRPVSLSVAIGRLTCLSTAASLQDEGEWVVRKLPFDERRHMKPLFADEAYGDTVSHRP
jgi:hypothetical protein